MFSITTIEDRIAELNKLPFNHFGKDFLLTREHSEDNLQAVLKLAEILRILYRNNISTRCFQIGLAISQFRDKSTRTRFSFASAAELLGLSLQELDETKSQISHGETVRETSNMISFLSEVIGIRDDMYIGRGNAYMREVAEALDEGFEKGVLGHRPGIINLQCDIDHPTQTMSDLLHIATTFGGLESLRGKKIAMSWAYSPSYGKPLSVPQGIITLMTRFGAEVVLAHPPGYELLPDTMEAAVDNARKSGGSFKSVDSMDEAFTGAHVVYPKSWAPFEVMKRRTELLKKGDQKALSALEKECLAENTRHIDWECNARRMALTDRGEALYMHCLPADISGVSCEHGEVAADVFERYRIRTYFEARYKPYVIAAMIVLNRFRDPTALMDHMLRQRKRRAGVF